MAAYNAGGSLTWAAMLNVTSFNSSVQSMVAQMAYAQRSASGLEASLKSIAAVGFASVVAGIAAITAAIGISTKAAAEWETQMMAIARVSIPNFDYSTPEGKAAFTAQSREFQKLYIDIPLKDRESLTKAAEPYALAGFEGESLYKLTEQTLKMVKATNYEVTPDDVANMIIKSAQINRQQSGIDIKDSVQRTEKMTEYSSNVMDKVLTVANKYTISASDLTDAIVDASGSAVQRGNANDIDSQLAFYATMNQYGIRPDLMRTALSSSVSTAGMGGESTARIEHALEKIGMQTRDAEGKKIAEFSRAEVAAKLLGVTEDRYRKMAEDNMDETQIMLLDAIEDLKVDRLTKNALETGMIGAYAGREFAKLGAGGALNTYREIEGVSKGSGGEVERYYQNTIQTLNDQWDLMEQRAWSIKEVFGEIFVGPVLNGVKGFSESLKGAVQWLTKIVDGSRNLDGTVNTWEAIGKVVSGVKQKLIDLGAGDALKMTGAAIGLALVASNLKTIGSVASLAITPIKNLAASLLSVVGITFGSTASAILGLAGPIATVVVAAAGLALGLAAIGYSLAPEKFTYFNQVASEALTGVSNLAKQLYADISAGDWGAAADHLKTAFTDAMAWIQGLDWSRLGGEIVTMIGDGANAIVNAVLDIGGWVYESLTKWSTGGGPYKLGETIGDFISDGLRKLADKDMWSEIKTMFGAAGNWLSLGSSIASGISDGLATGMELGLAIVHDMVLTAFANIVGMAAGIGAEISNAITSSINSISGLLSKESDKSGVYIDTYKQDDGTTKHKVMQDGKFVKSFSDQKTAEAYKVQLENPNLFASGASVGMGYSDNIKLETLAIKDEKPKEGSAEAAFTNLYNNANTQWNSFWKWYDEQPTTGELVTGLLKGKSKELETTNPDASKALSEVSDGINAIPSAIGTGFNSVVDTEKENLNSYIGNIQQGKIYSAEEIQAMKDKTSASIIEKNGGLLVPKVEEKLRLEKQAAENNIATQKQGVYESVNILRDGMFQSSTDLNYSIKDAVTYTTEKSLTTADFTAAIAKRTAEENAATTTQSYRGFTIAMDENGKQMAIIGTVAQGQFKTAGDGIVTSSSTFFGNAVNGGISAEGSMDSGGNKAKGSLFVGADAIEKTAAKLAAIEFRMTGGQSGAPFDKDKYGNGESATSYNNLNNTITDLGTSLYGFYDDTDGLLNAIYNSPFVKAMNNQTSTQSFNGELAVDNFSDMTCNGQTVMVNALKYTDPSGKTISVNPIDSQGVRNVTGNLEGEFQDMSCVGGTIYINGLKYTNPYGVTSSINPSEYLSGGGVLNYQQQSSQQAANITVDAAKTSSGYTKGAASTHAQAVDISTQRYVTATEYELARSQNAAIERDDLWMNSVSGSTQLLDASLYDFSQATNEAYVGAMDYLGATLTASSDIYKNNAETIRLYELQNQSTKGAASAMDGAASKMESAGSNVASSFGALLSQMSAGFGNPSGAWGGTSIGGGGRYIGMGSTNPATAVPWGGTAASLIVQQQTANNYPFGSVKWGAKGSLIEEPTRLIAGEAGRELLLPNYLTELFLKLAALGFNSGSSDGNTIVTIVNIDGEQVEKTVSKRQKSNLNHRGLKLH